MVFADLSGNSQTISHAFFFKCIAGLYSRHRNLQSRAALYEYAPSAGLMLGHCLGRRPVIKPAGAERPVVDMLYDVAPITAE